MGVFGKKYCKKGHKMDPSWDLCPCCIRPITGWFVTYDDTGFVERICEVHEGKNLIGSGVECDIRILKQGIPRHCAIVHSNAEEFSMVSQISEGLMMVNSKNMSSVYLVDGDIVSLGDHDFKFKSL